MSATIRYLRMKELPNITGKSRTQIYELIRKGEFIPPTILGPRTTGYRSDLLEAWLESRPFTGSRKGGLNA